MSPSPAMSSAPAWQVVSQVDQTKSGPNGTWQEGMLVTFITAAGITSSVFVPLAGYNPDNVKAAIQAKVDQLSAVAGLTG